jgi:hypothetical protein
MNQSYSMQIHGARTMRTTRGSKLHQDVFVAAERADAASLDRRESREEMREMPENGRRLPRQAMSLVRSDGRRETVVHVETGCFSCMTSVSRVGRRNAISAVSPRTSSRPRISCRLFPIAVRINCK